MDNLQSRSLRFVIVVLIAAALTACFNPFAPKLEDFSANTDLLLTDQVSPDDVLTNFRFAYLLKDSLVYRDLLDENFLFIWRDHENDQFVSWTKEEDVRSTVGLFNAFDMIDLVWNATNYLTYSSDSSQAEMSKQFILNLGSEIRITGDAQFFFRKLDTGVWRIIRWVDKSVV